MTNIKTSNMSGVAQPRWVEFITFGGVLIFQLVLLTAALLQDHTPVERLFQDMIAISNRYSDCCTQYDGAMSHAGVLMWCAAASVCFFAALILIGHRGQLRTALVFAGGGAFTSILMLDDLFTLHDIVLPGHGVPELAMFAFYAICAVVYLGVSRDLIALRLPIALGFTVAAFSLGLLIDIVKDARIGSAAQFMLAHPSITIVFEDGLKFLAIGGWFSTHVVAALLQLRRNGL